MHRSPSIIQFFGIANKTIYIYYHACIYFLYTDLPVDNLLAQAKKRETCHNNLGYYVNTGQ